MEYVDNLQVKTLRVTNRELSDACERRAFAMDDLRGRLQVLSLLALLVQKYKY
jgi:hypothetical protein